MRLLTKSLLKKTLKTVRCDERLLQPQPLRVGAPGFRSGWKITLKSHANKSNRIPYRVCERKWNRAFRLKASRELAPHRARATSGPSCTAHGSEQADLKKAICKKETYLYELLREMIAVSVQQMILISGKLVAEVWDQQWDIFSREIRVSNFYRCPRKRKKTIKKTKQKEKQATGVCIPQTDCTECFSGCD